MSSAFLEVFSFRYSESIYTFLTAGRIIYHLSSPDIQNIFYTFPTAGRIIYHLDIQNIIYTFPTAGRIIYHLSSPDIQNIFSLNLIFMHKFTVRVENGSCRRLQRIFKLFNNNI